MPVLNNADAVYLGTQAVDRVYLGANLAWSSAPAWTPAQLFGPTDKGAFFDFGNVASLFQDSAGTTPVTATSDPIGKVLDLSGQGNHITQSTATARPLWEASGFGLLDGVDDVMSAPLDMSSSAQGTLIISSKYLTYGPATYIAAHRSTVGAIYVQSGGPESGASSAARGLVRGGDANAFISTANGTALLADHHVQSMTVNFALGSAEARIRVNRSAWVSSGGNSGLGPLPNGTLTVGAQAATATKVNAQFWGMLYISRVLSDADIALVEDWFAAKAGVTLP